MKIIWSLRFIVNSNSSVFLQTIVKMNFNAHIERSSTYKSWIKKTSVKLVLFIAHITLAVVTS